MPKVCLKTLSVHLRTNLLTGGKFITAFPNSVVDLYARRFGLKVLPVDLATHPWPVVLLTVKHRPSPPHCRLPSQRSRIPSGLSERPLRNRTSRAIVAY